MTTAERRPRTELGQSRGTTANGYGPANPHPLSSLHTELVWEGKYDEFGNRRTHNMV